MNELMDGVNWLAVVVGFAASYLLGWLWYSPRLFGKQWAAGVGVQMSSGSEMPAAAMTLQALGTFGLAWLFGITAAANHLLTIILVVLTILLLVASNGKYAQKSNTAISIEVGYIVAMAVVMFVCQGIF